MKTYIITKKEIKQRNVDKVRRLARYLSERNNKKYIVYLCIPFSEIKNKEEIIFSDGQDTDFESKHKEALKEIEILRQTIKAKNVEIKTLKSEIDNLKTPLLKRLWAKIKNGNINIK